MCASLKWGETEMRGEYRNFFWVLYGQVIKEVYHTWPGAMDTLWKRMSFLLCV